MVLCFLFQESFVQELASYTYTPIQKKSSEYIASQVFTHFSYKKSDLGKQEVGLHCTENNLIS